MNTLLIIVVCKLPTYLMVYLCMLMNMMLVNYFEDCVVVGTLNCLQFNYQSTFSSLMLCV